MDKDPNRILQDKLGYKIVHFVKSDLNATTITNSTRTIRLNPLSFPFSGRCRIYLHLVASSSLIGVGAGNHFCNLTINVSQPYSQTNMPFNANNFFISTSNSILFTAEIANRNDFNVNNLTDTYVDAVLSPNSTIELNLVNETGDPCTMTTNNTGFLVHLYIKPKP